MLGQTPVAAGEVEQRVAGLESRAEREDQLGAVCEVAVWVRVSGLGPASPPYFTSSQREQALGVLAQEAQHRVQCHRFRRVKKCLSITALILVADDGARHPPALPAGLHRAVAEVDVLDVEL